MRLTFSQHPAESSLELTGSRSLISISGTGSVKSTSRWLSRMKPYWSSRSAKTKPVVEPWEKAANWRRHPEGSTVQRWQHRLHLKPSGVPVFPAQIWLQTTLPRCHPQLSVLTATSRLKQSDAPPFTRLEEAPIRSLTRQPIGRWLLATHVLAMIITASNQNTSGRISWHNSDTSHPQISTLTLTRPKI